MNIGFLWQCIYPWDVRLEKMIDASAEAGHRVCLVSKGRHGLKPQEQIGHAKVYRVFPRHPLLQGWPAKVLTYPLFVNPLWFSTALRAFKENEVDFIVVRDLPLAMLAVWLGERLKKPVLIDMAENYPAALLAYQNPVYKPFLVGNAWLPRKYEQKALERIAHVFVVAEEQRRRLVAVGVDAKKITLVGNTPVEAFVHEANGSDKNSAAASDEMNMLYVGKIDVHRGADLLIRALQELRHEFPSLRLTLVGNGKYTQNLVELARDAGLSGLVRFPGWVDWTRISTFIRESTVCLIPHRRSEHTDTTLPNKLFDYMAYAKPVIASDCLPLKRIIEEQNCGLTFKSGDVESLKAALRTILLEPNRDAMGRNGRRAVEQEYNWNTDKAALVDTLRHVGEGSAA